MKTTFMFPLLGLFVEKQMRRFRITVVSYTHLTVMLNLFVFPTCMLKPENPVKHWVDVSISWIISQDRVVSERTAKMPA